MVDNKMQVSTATLVGANVAVDGDKPPDQLANKQPTGTPLSPIEEEIRSKFPLDKLFRLAVKFNKETLLKVANPTYVERVSLAALILQAKYGPFREEKSPQYGALDLVGRDRKHAWVQLGAISQEDAKSDFVSLIAEICPRFWVYTQAINVTENQMTSDSANSNGNSSDVNEVEGDSCHETTMREEETRQERRKSIQEVLNKQTYSQFRTYAEQQYPGEPEEQETLIKQLQEQHYLQYMQQIYQTHHSNDVHKSGLGDISQPERTIPPADVSRESREESSPSTQSSTTSRTQVETTEEIEHSDHSDQDSELDSSNLSSPSVTPAQMWTRKDITRFKETVMSEGEEGVIKVGHGEVVTIRVPTHEEGKCIFWEFATDDYDIGFGVLFDWTNKPGTQVSVHISESESDEEEEEEGNRGGDVLENGAEPVKSTNSAHAGLTVIEQVYRRDSHIHVLSGNHQYPGKGCYLLKFDNSYSLWRPKTLYYRVYYTK